MRKEVVDNRKIALLSARYIPKKLVSLKSNKVWESLSV